MDQPKKASKRLYSLRIFKKVGVASDSKLWVHLTTIRPCQENWNQSRKGHCASYIHPLVSLVTWHTVRS